MKELIRSSFGVSHHRCLPLLHLIGTSNRSHQIPPLALIFSEERYSGYDDMDQPEGTSHSAPINLSWRVSTRAVRVDSVCKGAVRVAFPRPKSGRDPD